MMGKREKSQHLHRRELKECTDIVKVSLSCKVKGRRARASGREREGANLAESQPSQSGHLEKATTTNSPFAALVQLLRQLCALCVPCLPSSLTLSFGRAVVAVLSPPFPRAP